MDDYGEHVIDYGEHVIVYGEHVIDYGQHETNRVRALRALARRRRITQCLAVGRPARPPAQRTLGLGGRRISERTVTVTVTVTDTVT